MPQKTTPSTEQHILLSAKSAFARKGKDGARMQEIADSAGINKAMLHYYFRDKQKLYDAVLSHCFIAHAENQLAAIQNANTFEKKLKFFIEGFVESAVTDPDVVRLMVNENLAGGDSLMRLVHAVKEDDSATVPGLMIRSLDRAMETGEIRKLDPQQTLLSIISCCLFFLIWSPMIKARIPGAAEDWEGFVAERKKHIFDLIYHGLAVCPSIEQVTD